MKKIYILSDVHLGSWAIEHRRTHERRIVSFLDKIKDEASFKKLAAEYATKEQKESTDY